MSCLLLKIARGRKNIKKINKILTDKWRHRLKNKKGLYLTRGGEITLIFQRGLTLSPPYKLPLNIANLAARYRCSVEPEIMSKTLKQ